MATARIVAARYAKALFAVAQSHDSVDAVGRGVEAAATSLAETSSTRQFWANPLVESARKRAVLDRALEKLKDAIGPECARFLHVLLKNQRMAFLPEISRAYREMADEAAGRVPVEVLTAMPLSDRQKERLSDVLERAVGARPLLTVREDPRLLAGLVVKVADVVYDGSVRGKLERLTGRLSA